jgi:hypothetical protein
VLIYVCVKNRLGSKVSVCVDICMCVGICVC